MQLLPKLINDLEAPAFSLDPRLARLRSETEQRLARPVRMSGSGSSLFTLCDTLTEAENIRAESKLAERLGIEALAVELAVIPADDLNAASGQQ